MEDPSGEYGEFTREQRIALLKVYHTTVKQHTHLHHQSHGQAASLNEMLERRIPAIAEEACLPPGLIAEFYRAEFRATLDTQLYPPLPRSAKPHPQSVEANGHFPDAPGEAQGYLGQEGAILTDPAPQEDYANAPEPQDTYSPKALNIAIGRIVNTHMRQQGTAPDLATILDKLQKPAAPKDVAAILEKRSRPAQRSAKASPQEKPPYQRHPGWPAMWKAYITESVWDLEELAALGKVDVATATRLFLQRGLQPEGTALPLYDDIKEQL